MPEKNFCGVFFMSNEHFCSRCPNMYVFSHGDAPGFLSPHSSTAVPGDFLCYLCDVLESLFPFPAMVIIFRCFLTCQVVQQGPGGTSRLEVTGC